MHADIDTVKVVVKNVPDYAAGKEKNDLGFLTFDLQVILQALNHEIEQPSTFLGNYTFLWFQFSNQCARIILCISMMENFHVFIYPNSETVPASPLVSIDLQFNRFLKLFVSLMNGY